MKPIYIEPADQVCMQDPLKRELIVHNETWKKNSPHHWWNF